MYRAFDKPTDRFTFGKHKGETIEGVIQSEPQYVRWCIGNVGGFSISTPLTNLLSRQPDGSKSLAYANDDWDDMWGYDESGDPANFGNS